MCRRLIYVTLFVLVLGVVGPALGEAIDPNRVGWWKLDETSGTTAADSSGHNNNGTVNGGPRWVAGFIGGALQFNGSSNYVQVQRTVENDFTLMAWIKTNVPGGAGTQAYAGSGLIWSDVGGTANDFVFAVLGTKLSFFAGNPDVSVTSSADVVTGDWVHVAAVRSATLGQLSIYIDGKLEQSIPHSNKGPLNAQSVIVIGANTLDGRYYTGLIDDVQIFNRVLSAAEIKTLVPPKVKARNPSPDDGATGIVWGIMTWKPGDTAEFHNVYFGSTPTLGPANKVAKYPKTGMMYFNLNLNPGQTYYWRVDEEEVGGTIYTGDVWSFTTAPYTAYSPSPANGAKWLDPVGLSLTWVGGAGATSHDVYFGTNKADVESGTVSSGTFKINQLGTTYPQTGSLSGLEPKTTYYWRIDEITATTTYKGEVWSFTTIGPGGGVKAQYFANMDLSGSPALTQVETTINHSWGDLEVFTGHLDNVSARWTAELEVAFSGTWTFVTRTDDGGRLWVNGVQVTNDWSDHGARDAIGTIDLVAGETYPLVMEFYENGGGAVAILSWEGPNTARQVIPAGPLQLPLRASSPKPNNGAVNVKEAPKLQWNPGEKAVNHDVYFGTDKTAVAGATPATAGIYKGSQNKDATSYLPGTLVWNTTYYWRIDEVNAAAGADSPWKGSTWSFTTADFIVVDDFEDYNDFTSLIYLTWVDGYGSPAQGIPGNGTGSTVGNTDAPFAEPNTVHDGAQSMPFSFNNSGAGGNKRYSEAERTWTIPQDWTKNGVKALSLWFYGDPNNEEQFYVVIEDSTGNSKVVNHGNPDAWRLAQWQEWNIPLSEFTGVNLKSIKKMYIGTGNRNAPQIGGSGKFLIDDIRVYKSRCVPSMLKPAADLNNDCVVDYLDLDVLVNAWLLADRFITTSNPGNTNLVALYTLDGNAQDTSGKGNNGTVNGNPVWVTAGKVGGALKFNGSTDYIDCGVGSTLNITDAVSISAWIKLAATGLDQKLASNQDGTTGGYKMAVFTDNRVEFEIRTSANASTLNRTVAGGTTLTTNVWYHVVGVYSQGNYIRTYVNGVLDRELVTTSILGTSTSSCKIGSSFTGDGGLFNGTVDDVRIYNKALSAAEAAYLADESPGDGKLYIPVPSVAEIYSGESQGSRKIDLKDFAVLANGWLEEKLWP